MTREEFTNLILDSEQTLYRVAMSMLRNEKDCEDAVQTARRVCNRHRKNRTACCSTRLKKPRESILSFSILLNIFAYCRNNVQ